MAYVRLISVVLIAALSAGTSWGSAGRRRPSRTRTVPVSNSEDRQPKYLPSDSVPFKKPKDYEITISSSNEVSYVRAILLLLERHSDLTNDLTNTCRPAPGWYANVGLYKANFEMAERASLLNICYHYLSFVLDYYDADDNAELRTMLQVGFLSRLLSVIEKINAERVYDLYYRTQPYQAGKDAVEKYKPIFNKYNRRDVPAVQFEATVYNTKFF